MSNGKLQSEVNTKLETMTDVTKQDIIGQNKYLRNGIRGIEGRN